MSNPRKSKQNTVQASEEHGLSRSGHKPRRQVPAPASPPCQNRRATPALTDLQQQPVLLVLPSGSRRPPGHVMRIMRWGLPLAAPPPHRPRSCPTRRPRRAGVPDLAAAAPGARPPPARTPRALARAVMRTGQGRTSGGGCQKGLPRRGVRRQAAGLSQAGSLQMAQACSVIRIQQHRAGAGSAGAARRASVVGRPHLPGESPSYEVFVSRVTGQAVSHIA